MLITITATFTSEPVEESIAWWMHQLGVPATIRFAPYNQVFQQLLAVDSPVSRNRDGISVHLIRMEDWWQETGDPVGRRKTVERNLHDLAGTLRENSSRHATTHLICLCPDSPAAQAEAGSTDAFRQLEQAFARELADATGVYVITSEELTGTYPVADYYDGAADRLGHIPYTSVFFAALGTMVARRIYALNAAPRKVIVLDCDQTLWRGVCGEDGPGGVEIDPPRKALQEFMVSQHDAGMLLCLCSKNSEPDVWDVFRCHAGMPLKRDHLVSSRINWRPKSENLRALAAELKLGLDSFIFVDDNPAECAEVEDGCPEVLVVRPPSVADEIPRFLRHVWAFDHLRLTEEDRRRTLLYQENVRRERFHQEAPSFEKFLAGLGLQIDISGLRTDQLARVAQLTQRTNQLNFTTIRRTEAEIQKLTDEAGVEVLTVEVKDRFGDYGLVGLMILRVRDAAIEVDTFLLSCRALGKGVEHRMLAHLGELATARGCERVDVKLIRTPKNGPAFDFISSVAGTCLPAEGDEATCRLAAADLRAVTFQPKTADNVQALPPVLSASRPTSIPPASGIRISGTRLSWIATEMSEAESIYRAIAPAARANRPAGAGTAVAPRNALEHQLTALWETVLGIEPVGIEDNFFELGGHSLTAVRLLSESEKLTGKRVTLTTLLQAPTIAQLAPVIQQGTAPASEGLAELRADPAQANEPFPLTDLQQAYLAGRNEGFDLANGLHIYFEFDPDQFDVARGSATLRALIARQPMLRAVMRDDGTQQVLERVPDYEIELVDLRKGPLEDVTATLTALRERLSHQAFDVSTWPWFEIRAVRLDDDRFRLFVSYDAVMLDAWSAYRLAREFAALYANPAIDLPRVEVSFRDCVLAEIAARKSAAYRRAQQYWSGRLADLPPSPALPLAQSPGVISHPRVVRHSMTLDRERWQQFKHHATRHGITPGTALVAAYAEIIARWSSNRRFTLNLPIFNRPPLHPRINDVVGYFTSLSLLAVDLTEPGSFVDHARAMQQQLLDDLDHSAYSGVQVARDIARLRGPTGRTNAPIVTTNIMIEEGFQSPWAGRTEFALTQTPQVLLDQIVTVSDGALVVVWDAVAELFIGNMLEEMFDAFRDLLTRLADDEPVWLVVDSPVRLPQRLLPDETSAETGEMLHTLFLKQVPLRSNDPAVITPSRRLTYGELHRRALRIAHRLHEWGAQPNMLVAIVMEKGWEQIVAVLGALYSGAAYLPIDAKLPAERLAHLLRHGEVKIALTQSQVAREINWPEGVRHICVDEDGELAGELPGARQTRTDLAYVIYTSGSTGLPKGVMIDHRGAVNTIVDMNRRFRVTSSDRVLAVSSLSFDLSVYDVFGMLAAGGAIVIPAAEDARDPAHWAELVRREGVTIWNSVPALMKLFVDYAAARPEMADNKLRMVWLSGDWIPLTLPDQIRALSPKAEVISLGGATEASIWSILFPIGKVDPAWNSVPYGRAMVNQTFRVLDGALEPCPTWVTGRLYIGGIGLAKGYWRDPDKTAERFITHPRTGERLYHTGDLGRWLPDGNIEFFGREDFQVKIQGFRVELEEIEAALLQHPGLSAVVVMARGERQGDKRLVGYVVSRNGAPDPRALREFLLGKLPEYMVPPTFMVLDRLPLSSNGKVDRTALPDVVETSTAAGPVASGDTTARVARIVEGILNIGRIDPEANWLNLGATSLNMIGITNALEREMQFRPKVSELYRTPTIAALARRVDESQRGAGTLSTEDARLIERIKRMSPEEIKALLAKAKSG
ncbi:MAG TPA: amino acid adenylation domain-containing protein [Verrucomicrobiae bacterium]|nr:amino acid adenylation domain-containing protein [Verrucomicrobiae bacterium]